MLAISWGAWSNGFLKSYTFAHINLKLIKQKQFKLNNKKMKKTVLVIALAFGITGAFAQDLTSKKGEPMLPEANDWAISLNADPIFEFVGNAFSGFTGKNTAPGVNWLNGNHTIIGKKFIDEKTAYRVLVRLGLNSQTFKNSLRGDDQGLTPVVFPNVDAVVTDKYKHSSTNIAIGVGKEWRRGKTRLQGFYGADLMIWFSSSKDKYTYGNTMTPTPTAANQTSTPNSTMWQSNPDSANFGAGVASGVPGLSSRTTLNKSGATIGIGIRGFIGAEYFIFPKIAIGAEYGWGLGFQTTGKGKKTTEEQGLDANGKNQVSTIERVTEGQSKIGIDTDLNQGNMFGFKGSNTGTASLRVTFHF